LGETATSRVKNRNGFSLLELILVMVLIGIAAVMVTPFVGNVLSNLLGGRELSNRENQSVLALERFVRDIREAAIPIETATENGKKVLREDGNKLYVIDSGILFFVDPDENEHVLARNLHPDSDFVINSFGIITLNLVITLSDGGKLELFASAVPREGLFP